MSRMVEVVIDSVRVSLTNQQRIVVLREVDAERYLPIWIGPYEAEMITVALQEIEVARPQTHDLLKNVIGMLNGRLLRIEVISLKDEVFFGNLVVEVDGHTLNIDSRPSDALALAVRTHVPILIAKEVMDTAGVEPESDMRDLKPPAPSSALTTPPSATTPSESAPASSGNEERLHVFEDFLENLNLDNLDSNPGEDENEDEDDEAKPKP